MPPPSCSPVFGSPKALATLLALALATAPCLADETAGTAADDRASQAAETPAGTPAEAAAETVPAAPAVPPESPEALEQRLTSCSIPRGEEFFGLDWARRTSYRSVCLASHWVDSLFGEEEFDVSEASINGHFALVTETRDHGGTEVTPRVRTRVRLPQASKRLDLFFDRDKESQSIAGEAAGLRPESTLPGEESTNQLGFGYDLRRGIDELLNVRLGLRIRSWRPELFARSRYSVTLADTGTARWNLEQTLFWIKRDGVGETTALEYQRHLGGPFLFRWQNSATLSQQSDGLRWNSSLSLFQAIDPDRALQWSFGGHGETGQAERVAAYGPRVSFRERLRRRWLIVEVYTGVDRVQTEQMPVRDSQSYVGMRLEAHFSPQ